ncbi:MAG: T9SS type A sorting domain-containing protein [Flavobacteriales bacterium]|nr:T9SS type A sorting domain-containing protein [Flavobacteriales bacterium]
MYRLLTLGIFGILFCAFQADAQTSPVFTFSDFAPEAYEMPKQFTRVSLEGTLFQPASGENQTWDFSSHTRVNPQPKNFYASRDTFFTQANIVEPGYQDYIKGTFIPYELYMHFGQDGNQIIGRHYPRFAYDLEYISGTAGDSLIIHEQAATSVPGNFTYRFPQTYPGIHAEESFITVNGSISFALAGYNQTPFVKKTQEIRYEEIIGYGQAIIPVNGGTATYPCLMQRSKTITIDSFFVDGQIVPDMLLNAFGLSQGLMFDRSQTHLFIPGAYLPLVTFVHSDANFGPVDAIYMQYDILGYAAIPEAEPSTNFRVYPNPCYGNILYFAGDKSIKNIEITSLTGQSVFKSKGVSSWISVPEHLSNGIYIITLETNEEKENLRWILNR